MESDVFEEGNMDRTDLVLLGASHLSKIRKHLNVELWNVIILTKPGWRISAETVGDLVAEVTKTAASVNWDAATIILQLFDNSIFMVGGQGGEKTLPRKDQTGTYHIDGHLVIADKTVVKGLVGLLMPLIKLLENSQKIFLTPLTRYWVAPCCGNESHCTNYRLPGYLPRLGDVIHALRDNIRDGLFTR
jgi:hypothetical protein